MQIMKTIVLRNPKPCPFFCPSKKINQLILLGLPEIFFQGASWAE
jgi:hypothetical protein